MPAFPRCGGLIRTRTGGWAMPRHVPGLPSCHCHQGREADAGRQPEPALRGAGGAGAEQEGEWLPLGPWVRGAVGGWQSLAVPACPLPTALHPPNAKWQQLGCMPASPRCEPGCRDRAFLLFLLPITLCLWSGGLAGTPCVLPAWKPTAIPMENLTANAVPLKPTHVLWVCGEFSSLPPPTFTNLLFASDATKGVEAQNLPSRY